VLTRGGLATLLVLATLAAVPALAGAATFTVNTTEDNPAGPDRCEGVPEDCSLREAIGLADGYGGPNTIVVPAGTYDLTLEPTDGGLNEDGDLNVSDEELTIEGAGAASDRHRRERDRRSRPRLRRLARRYPPARSRSSRARS
jgi:CSLREA domain-containing protein